MLEGVIVADKICPQRTFVKKKTISFPNPCLPIDLWTAAFTLKADIGPFPVPSGAAPAAWLSSSPSRPCAPSPAQYAAAPAPSAGTKRGDASGAGGTPEDALILPVSPAEDGGWRLGTTRGLPFLGEAR